MMAAGMQMMLAGTNGGGGGYSVALTPSKSQTNSLNPGFSSALVMAVVTGGTPPYSYAWAKRSGGDINCASPTSAASQFSVSSMALEEDRSANFRLSVTDATAAVCTSDLSVSMFRIGSTQ